jgi:NAD(P)-dependent dehydrogenase (short-subunit alcohol dehydrogenase family)
METNTAGKSEKKSQTEDYAKPPFNEKSQTLPGSEKKMNIRPDHGENSYRGHNKLKGLKAIITGGDSGIGKAVAIAFAREGADVLISYLNEEEDAKDTANWVEKAGQKALLYPGDISQENHCIRMVEKALTEFETIDIIVNNAATQMPHKTLQEISSQEWDYTFRTNVYSMFYILKAAEPHLSSGATVINTTSVNAYTPSSTLIPYTSTKAAIQNFTATLAQLWAEKGIRVNGVAPGPIWTPLIPASFPEERVKEFGKQSPAKRPGQPAELAAVYVLLASSDSSYMSGSTVQVTGGMPTI